MDDSPAISANENSHLGSVFDWYEFPEGRARFETGIRYWDERAHETFVLTLDDVAYWGEIEQAYLPNERDFDVDILSFGYRDPVLTGYLGARTALTPEQCERVEALIERLIAAGIANSERPFVLYDEDGSRFTGNIKFRPGWALMADQAGVA